MKSSCTPKMSRVSHRFRQLTLPERDRRNRQRGGVPEIVGQPICSQVRRQSCRHSDDCLYIYLILKNVQLGRLCAIIKMPIL